jgi:hypothetical protein
MSKNVGRVEGERKHPAVEERLRDESDECAGQLHFIRGPTLAGFLHWIYRWIAPSHSIRYVID